MVGKQHIKGYNVNNSILKKGRLLWAHIMFHAQKLSKLQNSR